MSSNITTYSNDIDEAYPVAGRDNNSQGFRDNFSSIKNALTTAGEEITDLQNQTAKTNGSNNFNGNLIENATTNNLFGVVNTETVNTSSATVGVSDAEYHIFNINSTSTLSLTDWGTNGYYQRIRLHLVNGDKQDNYVVTISGTGNSTIRKNYSGPIILDTIGTPVILDIWSTDSGTNIYINRLGEFS